MSTPELPSIARDLRDQLRRDIEERGVLVPVIIADDGEVLDGRLRMEIAAELGLKAVPRIVVGKLNEAERRDLRFCVNVYRRQLNQAQVRELIAWSLRKAPESSDRCVAKQTGASHPTVARVRRELEAGGTIYQVAGRNGSDGKSYPSTRKPIVYAASESLALEARRLLGELGDHAPDRPLNFRDLRTLRYEQIREELLSKTTHPARLGDDFKIHSCDFRKLGNRVAPESVSLILTDPPWEARLGPEIAGAAIRLLKPDGILPCFTGTYYLPYFLEHFRAASLRYEWTVAEVHRFRAIRNSGQVKSQWSPIVIFRKEPKGRLRLNQILEDVLRFEDVDKSLHPWQQSLATSESLIRSLSRPGDLVCDLFVGSGTVPAAVASAGEGRRFAGCEIDARLVRASRVRVSEVLARQEDEGSLELVTS